MTVTDEKTQQTQVDSRRNRRVAPQVVGGVVLLIIGALWLIERTGIYDLTVTTVLAIGTILVGVALMLLAADGPHGGLIVFGTLLAVVATITAMAPLEGFQGGVGERVVEITDVDELDSDYDLAMGNLTIDLREMDEIDGIASISASVGMGELVIRVADDFPVSVTAEVGAGDIEIFDREASGLGVDLTHGSDSYVEGGPGLIIDANVFMGRVEVTNG